MKWYLWIVGGILAVNVLVVIAVGLFLLYDWIRGRREASDSERRSTHSEGS
jgi:uncharacterized membrane protein